MQNEQIGLLNQSVFDPNNETNASIVEDPETAAEQQYHRKPHGSNDTASF